MNLKVEIQIANTDVMKNIFTFAVFEDTGANRYAMSIVKRDSNGKEISGIVIGEVKKSEIVRLAKAS
jgi:hypothetical protein